MADVFISHSSKDHEIAEQICEGLEANGISCWMAPRDITAGTEWAAAINNAISSSKVFLIVYGENSAMSKQVSKELGLAGARGIPMIPYKIDGTALAAEFEYYLLSSHWIAADAKSGDYKFAELRQAVMELLRTENSAPVVQSALVAQRVHDKYSESRKPALTTSQQEAPVQPVRNNTAKADKKKVIPFIAAAAALVAVIAVVLAVVLSGGSGESTSGESIGTSDEAHSGSAGESSSQSDADTSPATNCDVMIQAGVDIEPAESEGCLILANSYDESFSVGGVKYNTGILLAANHTENTVSFNVDGVYEKMSFCVGKADGVHVEKEMTVRVYLDDNEAQPITLNNYDITKLCEYDITGVKTVRLKCDHLFSGSDIAFTDFYFSSTLGSSAPSRCISPFDESLDMLALPNDLAPYDSNHCYWLADSYDKSFSVGGTEYNTGVVLNTGDVGNTVAFNANGVYKKLSFRAGRVDGGYDGRDMTVRVYLDGNEAQPVTLTKYDITKLCEYDITDVKQIRIECDHFSMGHEIALTDLYLCKSEGAEVPTSFTSPFDESLDMLALPNDLAPYDSSHCYWLADSYDNSISVAGVKYSTGVMLDSAQGDNTVAFNVNGIHKKLSFRVGRVDGVFCDSDVTIRVWLDGKEAQPITLTQYDITKLCEYDITGTKQIRIECDDCFLGPNIALTDFYVCKSDGAEVPTSFTSPFDESLDTLAIPADLAPYDSDVCDYLADSYDDSFTIDDVSYNTGVKLYGSYKGNSVAFNVNGKYNKLSFSAGQIDSDFDSDTKVRIYFDGKEQPPLILSPGGLNRFEYDITGVNQIRIKRDGDLSIPDVGITDIVVSK